MESEEVCTEAALEEQLAVLGLTLSKHEVPRLVECFVEHSVNAEDGAERWASMVLSDPNSGNSFDRLFATLQRELACQNERKPDIVDILPPPQTMMDTDILADYLDEKNTKSMIDDFVEIKNIKNEAITKVLAPATYSPTVSQSEKYSSRTNAGSVLCNYGNEDILEKTAWCSTSGDVCHIRQVPNFSESILTSKAMYGFELLQNKANLLDTNIKYISQFILKKAKINETASLVQKSQVPITVVGRIECDSNGRLNTKSVLLQGGWEKSFGHNIPVDIDQLKQYTLFPGQIVAMTGLNMHGSKFVAQEIFSDASYEPPSVPVLHNSLNGSLQIVAVSGPFTTSDSLNYDPLTDLIQYVIQNKPHVVIMIGPFLDANHPLIVKNTLAETFKSFFENLVERILTSISSASPHTQVVMVASSRDVFHTNIYPTPPFLIKKNYPNLTLVPDPCILNIGEVNIGITATDILMHLSKEEISMPLQGQDKMGRLASQLFHQQNFYPLFPPNMSVSLDTMLWNDFAALPFTPHVLLLPSDFRYFAKKINGCVVINPERLTKGHGGGTFARIQINSFSVENILCQIMRI